MILSLIFGFGQALAAEPPTPDALSWQVIQSKPVEVGCAESGGQTWCRSVGKTSCKMETLDSLIQDFSSYPSTFPRVEFAKVIEGDVVHIYLSMPMPFSPRDYVVSYKKRPVEEGISFQWTPSPHKDVPVGKKAVRLEEMAGSWTFVPNGDGTQKMIYIWNANLKMDVPSWGVPIVRKTQGAEVMDWMNDACTAEEKK